MAGIPFFITGANAKIRLNNKTLAFCTDLSYTVNVVTETPRLLGMYEAASIEPVAYEVSGSFSVIRYAQGLQSQAPAPPPGVSDEGNGVGAWGGSAGAQIFGFNSKLEGEGRPHENFNPARLKTGTTFDIEVFQKAYIKGENKEGLVAKIRNARLTSLSFSINKKSAVIEGFTFKALYLDEDSFIAETSGNGQNL